MRIEEGRKGNKEKKEDKRKQNWCIGRQERTSKEKTAIRMYITEINPSISMARANVNGTKLTN